MDSAAVLLHELDTHVAEACVESDGDKESLRGSKFEPYSKDVVGYTIT